MNLLNKFLVALLSILVASLSLFIIEYYGFATNVQKYFFGEIENLGQLKVLLKTDWLNGIKSIMFLLFAFFVMYVMFFVLVFESFALIYFLVTSRWQNPKVFISYKNYERAAEVNTTKMALTIKAHLEKKGIKVLFFEFTESLHHDKVNFEIQKMLRECNAMVVIPDPYQPSYVDSEILYASTERKPVFIIKHTKNQKLPNTANSGHTVLLWDNLKEKSLEPLNYLLQYVHNYWNKRWFIITTPLVSFLFPLILLDEDQDNFLKSILIFGVATLALVYFSTDMAFALGSIKLLIASMGAIGAYFTMFKIIKTSRFQKVIRQSILSGGSTYEHYLASEINPGVIHCLDKNGLRIQD